MCILVLRFVRKAATLGVSLFDFIHDEVRWKQSSFKTKDRENIIGPLLALL